MQLAVSDIVHHGKAWQVTHASALQGVLTVGDYDGVVSQMDVSSGHLLADRDDHSGQRSGACSAMQALLCEQSQCQSVAAESALIQTWDV